MSGINKVILVGNIGAKPEVKYSSNGSAIANLSVATSETWNDKNSGEKQEKTEWHRVSLYGKLAEIAGQYLDKGSKVYVEGRLQTRKWQDQSGQDRYTTEIVVDMGGTMQMLDSRGGGDTAYNQDQNTADSTPTRPVQQNNPSQSAPSSQPMDTEFDDDIPF